MIKLFLASSLLLYSSLCHECTAKAASGGVKIFPQRSNNESALLEWGHSAMIQAADAVVAQFGLQAWEEEFKLGIEAAPVFANPPHGCQPLRNSKSLKSQMVLMARGMCDFETKAKYAVESGAAVLIVINDEQRPNHAFSMGRKSSKNKKSRKSKQTLVLENLIEEVDKDVKEKEELNFNPQIPCLMISLNSWQAISEDKPDSLRLYPGQDSPFIETVQEFMPSISIIHNFFSSEETKYLVEKALSVSQSKSSSFPFTSKAKKVMNKNELSEQNNDHSLTSKLFTHSIRSYFNSILLPQANSWTMGSEVMIAIQDKMSAVLDFPVAHFSDFEILQAKKNTSVVDFVRNVSLDEVSKMSSRYPNKDALLNILVCLGNNAIEESPVEYNDELNGQHESNKHSLQEDINSLTFLNDMALKINLRPGMAVVYEPAYPVRSKESYSDIVHRQQEQAMVSDNWNGIDEEEDMYSQEDGYIEYSHLQPIVTHTCEFTAILRIFAAEISFAERQVGPLLAWAFPSPISASQSPSLSSTKSQDHMAQNIEGSSSGEEKEKEKDEYRSDLIYSPSTGLPQWVQIGLNYLIQLFGEEGGFEVFYQTVLVTLVCGVICLMVLIFFLVRYLAIGSSSNVQGSISKEKKRN